MIPACSDNSASSRPVQWRLRADLELSAANDQDSSNWVIKDPLRLIYFQLNHFELSFLRCLDGRRTLAEIVQMLRSFFPEKSPAPAELQQFLLTSVQAGLLQPTVPGYGAALAANTRRVPSVLQILTSCICFRFRGVDPTPVLKKIYPAVRWLFRPPFPALAAAFTTVATMLILLRLPAVIAELPSIAMLASWNSLIGLLLAIVLVKIVHELSHAITCHHFGGECHELGVLLVAFVPLMYCDVSDSWSQSDRWKRIAVAAAGIAVELFIAAICGILWMLSHPGTLHTFFLNTMIVCSLNTLLINGNPLMRYDGYYILSDLLRIPNLAAQSRVLAAGSMKRVVFGNAASLKSPFSPLETAALAMFGVASACYRVLVLSVILMVLYSTLQPYGLQALVAMPACALIFGPLSGVVLQTRRELQLAEHPRRARAGLAAIGLTGILLMFFPWASELEAPCQLIPGASVPVYVPVPGRIRTYVSGGDSVRKGQLLAKLHNPDIAMQIVLLESEIREREDQLQSVQISRTSDRQKSAIVRVAQQSIAASRQRLQKLLQMQQDLQIRSPRDGTVFLPRNVPKTPLQPDQPTFWSGWALSEQSNGAWVDRQTLLCWVGNAEDLRVTSLIAETDVELLTIGTAASIRFLSRPEDEYLGQLESLDDTAVEHLEREYLVNGLVAVSSSSPARPAHTMFQAKLTLPQGNTIPAPLYATGIAHVTTQPQSLLRRGWRLICQTFSFGI